MHQCTAFQIEVVVLSTDHRCSEPSRTAAFARRIDANRRHLFIYLLLRERGATAATTQLRNILDHLCWLIGWLIRWWGLCIGFCICFVVVVFS